MELASLWKCLVLAGSLCLASGDGSPQESPNPSSPDPRPLFLTPLIRNCSYEEAKKKSEVHLLKQYNITNASAYSGYITVNETTGSNLFFFFIEAENNATDAPLMLWTPGGPGLSALFAMLLQNGPAEFVNGVLSRRELTIQKSMSVIYLDVDRNWPELHAESSRVRNKNGGHNEGYLGIPRSVPPALSKL
uniref:Putative serine carboxypeptidase n=1 Tax=Amblyomma americanum TaxID=6943 RepID=A0A0C9S512_AMBAM